MDPADPSDPSDLSDPAGPERAAGSAAMPQPDFADLAALNAALAAAEPGVTGSRRAVPGEGPVGAAIAFVGEQPGDQEDLAGRPFVGPAGRLLDRALREARIPRGKVYVTNAVKHFKFEPRGKRRIHRKPTAGEVAHYRWWLNRELDLVHPAIVVALGATAVLALAGRAMPVTRARGPADFDGRPGYITVHPSYLLRIPDPATRAQAYGTFVADLKQIRSLSRRASVKTAT